MQLEKTPELSSSELPPEDGGPQNGLRREDTVILDQSQAEADEVARHLTLSTSSVGDAAAPVVLKEIPFDTRGETTAYTSDSERPETPGALTWNRCGLRNEVYHEGVLPNLTLVRPVSSDRDNTIQCIGPVNLTVYHTNRLSAACKVKKSHTVA